ncbi:MAG: ribosome recycling factor [Firmicutes bacterium]|nr:ribosome recycling factor [Bacillota bacterium]
MVKEVIKQIEDKMKKTCELFRKELSHLKAGRATPALLDKVLVDYYGTATPISQMANISVPEPRLLVIQPWDKSAAPAIEKAIMKSDLGLTPSSDGTMIRLAIPQLTEERRKDLVKQVNKLGEEQRVAVRNERREGNELVKAMEKKKEISEDDAKRAEAGIQKVTDRYIKEIDDIVRLKEKEIMEV